MLVIEAGGLRLLTDPTFDQPGPFDVVLLTRPARRRSRLAGAGAARADHLGRRSAARRIRARPAAVVPPQPASFRRRRTAHHGSTGAGGPNGTTHTGFVLSSVDTPAVYVSGGNASLDVVQ